MKRSQVKLSADSVKWLFILFGLLSPIFISAQTTLLKRSASGSTTVNVPSSAVQYLIRITVRGADGGDFNLTAGRGGSGAEMTAEFVVPGGTPLKVKVGAAGRTSNFIRPRGGGGGGGTAVLIGNEVLIAAAGGGGAGGSPVNPSQGLGGSSSEGGNGMGGQGSSLSGYAASGGGFQTAGTDGIAGSGGGGSGLSNPLGQGGSGGEDAGNGGSGFGGGGGGAGIIGGGGGGFTGGYGGVKPTYGGEGGRSRIGGDLYGVLPMPGTDGIDGGGTRRDGFVEILLVEALPVELLSFAAKSKGKKVQLNWMTSLELNNRGFEVEHSENGLRWQKIGFVKGNGTTASLKAYEFLHEDPLNGDNYYRLKQLDFDGAYEYSKIINVTLSREITLALFPNPTSGSLLIRGIEVETARMDITDKLGKVIKSMEITGQQVDISNLPNGLYFITINHSTQTYMNKVIKQ